ncbi:MAG TPA: cytochrome P450 [Trebonia sp.]|nr:cytochrome P450 [Trebonia sp.]
MTAAGPAAGTAGGDDFDPDDPAGLADPEGLYGRLRAHCPVAHSNRYGGFWAVTRYRDVQRVMRDPVTFSSAQGIVIPRNPASGRRPPLHYDPPEHTAYRKVISPVFRRERLRWLAPAVTALAGDLVSALPEQAELYADFCSPYAAQVVCLLLNIPGELTGQFAAHMDRFEDAQRRRDVPVIEAENQYLYGLCREVAARRAAQPLDPADDMLSALLAARVDGEPVTAETAAGSLRQIVVAGHGAPALALASAALHLAEDPALQTALRAGPDLVPPFVEEMLRLHTPNVGFARTTTAPARVGRCDIPAGQPVAVVLPAANQDPEIFGRPAELDLTRGERHLAFGDGPHVCPGAVPGRDLLVAGVRALLTRAPFAVGGEVAFSPWPTAGPVRLPVRLAAVRA